MSAAAIFSSFATRKSAAAANAARRGTPGFTARLVVVADHAIDLGHLSEHCRLYLRCTACDDDARRRPLALQFADRLPRLRHRLVGNGSTLDDDDVVKAGIFRVAANDFGFEGIEPATEVMMSVDGHQTSTLANSAGSKVPEISRTRPGRSSAHDHRARAIRQSDCRPAAYMFTMRWRALSARRRHRQFAQAAEPQAFVRPAPRSQVRIVM